MVTEEQKNFSKTFVLNTLNWHADKEGNGWWLICKSCQDYQIKFLRSADHRKDRGIHRQIIADHIADEKHKYNHTLNRLSDEK